VESIAVMKNNPAGFKDAKVILAELNDQEKKANKRKRHNREQAPKGERPAWLAHCIRSSSKEDARPLGNVANVLLALREDPAFVNIVAFDEMARTTMLMHPLGNPNLYGMVFYTPVPLRDEDATGITEALQHAGLCSVTEKVVQQALLKRARERTFHPIRGYLDALKGDGRARLETWLARGLGAEQTAYTAGIGRMFLISMVARIYQPGCKVDHTFVLEGPQGALKSTLCRVLAGEDWFSDGLRDIHSKDASQHLRGKWVIELAEIHQMHKATPAELKSFLSRQIEIYRPSYARFEVHEARQCVFVGTTNDADYLRDATGGRRFWPVACGAIDLEWMRANRDQLFAEAVALYRQDVPWWPDKAFERKHIEPEQETRFESDPWQERVEDYVATFRRITVRMVLGKAIDLKTAQQGTREQRRVTSILVAMGWKRVRSHGVR
jgi:predicted P-loop ATPase